MKFKILNSSAKKYLKNVYIEYSPIFERLALGLIIKIRLLLMH